MTCISHTLIRYKCKFVFFFKLAILIIYKYIFYFFFIHLGIPVFTTNLNFFSSFVLPSLQRLHIYSTCTCSSNCCMSFFQGGFPDGGISACAMSEKPLVISSGKPCDRVTTQVTGTKHWHPIKESF